MKWICQICHIVRSVRESDLWSVRPWESEHGLTDLRVWSVRPICEAVRVRSDSTGRCCHPRGRLTDFTAKHIASAGVRERPIGTSDSHGLTDLWGRSDSQICEADLWGRGRPICEADQTLWQITWLSSERPCSDSHGLTDRPHRFESPIGLSRTPGDAVRSSELSDWFHG